MAKPEETVSKNKNDSKNKAEKFWYRMAKNYDKEEKQDEPVLLNIIVLNRTYKVVEIA